MILTCPNCSARFMIDARALGATGRTVRCGACGHSWLQLPDPAEGEAEMGRSETEASSSDAAMAQAGAAAARRAADVAAQETAESERRQRRRAPRSPEAGRGPAQHGYTRILTWFVFVFVIAALLLGGYKYRQDVVRLWPPATRLYNALGISVAAPTGYGLRVPVDSIKFRREAEGGTPILVVSGEIVNTSDHPQRVTPMRISLLDKDNRVLRTESVKLEERVLAPGKKLPFQTSIPNSPAEAVSVRITFEPSP
jgi:predicted Zn finger-like uncharacterized protein